MRKGYTITIVCLLLALGTLCGMIYFDLFREDATTVEQPVDLSQFVTVMQAVEDSKTVGGHLQVIETADSEPILFQYDQPFCFWAEILKEEKAACLYTTYESDYVTFTGYYELYYENGWQLELQEDGKPVMYIERIRYHYEDAVGVYTNGTGTYIHVLSVTPSLDKDKGTASVELVHEQTYLSAFTCGFDAVTGTLHVSSPTIQFDVRYNPEAGGWDTDDTSFAALQFTKAEGMPDTDDLTDYTADFRIEDQAGRVWIQSRHLASAEAGLVHTENSDYAIILTLTEEGKTLMAQATANNMGKTLAIYVEDQQITTPAVESVISDGVCYITGFATYEEAETVARILQFAIINN